MNFIFIVSNFTVNSSIVSSFRAPNVSAPEYKLEEAFSNELLNFNLMFFTL